MKKCLIISVWIGEPCVYVQALQIALVHLCFNVIGILIFYPIPYMRWPIHMARILGDITSRYRSSQLQLGQVQL
jgi:sodium-dependent phosphate cotransporter